jgi:hypothetical protein
MKMVDTLFEKLAERFCAEPKLSDMVWAMCETSEMFQSIFLEFCFGKNVNVSGEIIREYNRNGSIPDFYFTDVNGNEYIIENKIYDHRDHFEQYELEFENAERAFIANYIVGKRKDWSIKNWKSFIKYLENKISDENSNKEEIKLIQSFVLYLKSVTHYREAKTMNFLNLSSLSSFYGIVSELIKQMDYWYYNIPSATDADYYGRFFINKENVYIWIGLYIPEPSGVYIVFRNFENKSWCPETEQNKIKEIIGHSGEYYDNVVIENRSLYIHLKDEHYKKLCDNNINVDDQKDIIQKFMEEVLKELK